MADDMADWQSVAAVQTERVLRLVREVFGRDVLGAYEHGSAVMGGVQPTSDVDILVITGRSATLVEKHQLVEGLMTISAPWPPPGPERCVEVTVVAQPQVRPWRYIRQALTCCTESGYESASRTVMTWHCKRPSTLT